MKALHQWRYKPDFKLGASANAKSKNNAALRGIRYHQRVYKQLAAATTPPDDLLIEPWFKRVDDQPRPTMRSPDAVLRFADGSGAIVIEVKLNWRDGRDEKLLYEYLPIVRSAFDVDVVWPLLITSCLRGYNHPPLLGLQQFDECLAWEPGRPTPLMLLP